MSLPNGAVEDSEHPGWYGWGEFPRGSFASATGKLLFKPDGPGRARCRIFPTKAMLNISSPPGTFFMFSRSMKNEPEE